LPTNKIILMFVIVSGWILFSSSAFSNSKNQLECDTAMETSFLLNAPDLWRGASACEKSGDIYSTRFLLLSGRLRAMTDIVLLKPETDKDKIKLDEIYNRTFLIVNNLGDDEIYRDMQLTNRLIKALQVWNPVLKESYDPGWKYQSNINTLKYEAMVECQKAIRINALNYNASLARNDDYYEAVKELKALIEKHSEYNNMKVGLQKKYDELVSRMREVNAKYRNFSSEPKECEIT